MVTIHSGGRKVSLALKVWSQILALLFFACVVGLVWEFSVSGTFSIEEKEPAGSYFNDSGVLYSAECRADNYFPSITDLDNSRYSATGFFEDRRSIQPTSKEQLDMLAAEGQVKANAKAAENYLDHIESDYKITTAVMAVLAVLFIITGIIRRKR